MSKNLREGRLKTTNRDLVKLSIPIFLELLLVTIVGNVDTVMLGKYSDQAVATAGGMSQLLNIQNVIFGFISLGTSILIAQYVGAKNKKKIHETITVALILNFILGIALGVVFYFLWGPLLKSIKLPTELLPIGENYFKLVGGLCIFQAVTLTCGAIMKSHGNPTPMLYINIGVNLINIVGNGMFIFGWFGAPILGVTGVGISTVVSRGIGCITGIFVMMKFCRFQFRHKFLLPFPIKTIKNMLSIGIPAAGENLAWNIAQIMILSMVNAMGETYIASRTYLMLIANFVMTFSISLGQGTAIQIGQLIGAQKKKEAYDKCFSSLKLSIYMAFGVTVLIYLLKVPIMHIFTKDIKVLALAYKVFPFIIFLEVGRVFNIVIINSLHAAGDIKFPMFMGIISMFGIAVTLSYLLGVKCEYTLAGIWIANGLDEWFRGFAMYFRWKSRKWESKSFV
ncbi:MATE family efflux transporter [Fusobacterium sp. PH5-44]|uniref:MATE family efflux transporter n=1 Tax=unclassified Fusobacterium TaxID=2648384 RepID=UPI003D1B7EA3